MNKNFFYLNQRLVHLNKNIFHLYDHFVHMNKINSHLYEDFVHMKKKIFQMNGARVQPKIAKCDENARRVEAAARFMCGPFRDWARRSETLRYSE
jgi:hypothetical protein